MTFRNRLVRVSQLVADRIVGAYIATDQAPNTRVVLDNGRRPGQLDNRYAGKVRFYTAGHDDTDPLASIGPNAATPVAQVVFGPETFSRFLEVVGNAVRLPRVRAASLDTGPIAADSIKLGGAGSTLTLLGGTSSVVQCPANGAELRVGHNLGAIPSLVLVTGASSAYNVTTTDTPNAATFGVTIRTPTGANPAAGTLVRFNWLALVVS